MTVSLLKKWEKKETELNESFFLSTSPTFLWFFFLSFFLSFYHILLFLSYACSLLFLSSNIAIQKENKEEKERKRRKREKKEKKLMMYFFFFRFKSTFSYRLIHYHYLSIYRSLFIYLSLYITNHILNGERERERVVHFEKEKYYNFFFTFSFLFSYWISFLWLNSYHRKWSCHCFKCSWIYISIWEMVVIL